MEARKNSRKLAVQAVFQFFFSKEDINKILEQFCDYRIKERKDYKKKIDVNFLKNIVSGVNNHEKKITNLIESNLSNEWLLDRVDPTMHAILSLALYELIYCKDIPDKVIINEYVTIAQQYMDDNNTGFVNAILDTIAKKIRTSDDK